MKSYVIHLIRNGISDGNLEGKYIGRTDSPLSDTGLKGLLKLKLAHGYPNAIDFYAAPSTRCVDSLRILYPEADPQVILEMAECDFGDWEGKTANDLKNDPDFLKWIENGSKTAPPNGESGIVFMQRVCKGFEILVQNLIHLGNTTAVLVASSTAIMSILTAYGLPKANFYDWMCEPGCGYSIRITPGLWMRSNVVEIFAQIPNTNNDTSSNDYLAIDLARDAAHIAYGADYDVGSDSK